jgi:hypothetical protein
MEPITLLVKLCTIIGAAVTMKCDCSQASKDQSVITDSNQQLHTECFLTLHSWSL